MKQPNPLTSPRMWLFALIVFLASSCGISFAPGESGSCDPTPLIAAVLLEADSIRAELGTRCTYDGEYGTLNCNVSLRLLTRYSINVFPNLDTNHLQLQVENKLYTRFDRYRELCNGPDCYTCVRGGEFDAMQLSLGNKAKSSISIRLLKSDSVKKFWDLRLVFDSSDFPSATMDTLNKGIVFKVNLQGARQPSRYFISGDAIQSTWLVPQVIGDTTLLVLDSNQCKQLPYPGYQKGYSPPRFRFGFSSDSGLVPLSLNDSLVGGQTDFTVPITGSVRTYLTTLVGNGV